MIPVSGGEIWAEDTGGDGPPVVLVNANWTTAGVWSPLVGRLDGRCRVIRYDDRGYGRSPAPSVAFTRLADLRAVLDHTGAAAAVVVGHSGGGGTALGLALSEPERVASLLLIAPGAPDYPWPQDDPYLGEFSRLFAAGDREGLVSLGLKTWAAAGDDAAAVAEISGAVSGFFTVGELEQADPPAYQRLAEVRTPAVVIRGDREYPMVADSSDRIASRIPGCRHVVVAGADHLLPLRAADQLAQIIMGLTGLADRFVRPKIFENLVAHADPSSGQDVGPETAAVDKVLDDAAAGQPLQVEARLAKLDPLAFDVADPEPLADQVVDPDAAHHDLPPRLRAGQADVLQYFGLDQGQRLTRAGPAGEEVAVALQAMAGDGLDGADRTQRVAGADVDGLHMHAIHHRVGLRARQPSLPGAPGHPAVRKRAGQLCGKLPQAGRSSLIRGWNARAYRRTDRSWLR